MNPATATLQQAHDALQRYAAYMQLAAALHAVWPLRLARQHLQEAQLYLALAKEEYARTQGGTV